MATTSKPQGIVTFQNQQPSLSWLTLKISESYKVKLSTVFLTKKAGFK